MGVLCFTCLTARSQADEKLPKQFYKRDYASAPGYDETQRRVGKEPPRSKTRDLTSSPIPDTQGGRGATAALGTVKVRNPKRLAVQVFVNSLDHTHFARVVDAALHIHDRGYAVVMNLFHIGDYQAVTPAIEQALADRGISVVQVEEVPVELFAEVSPVWKVATPIGYHVAEGFIEIGSFFDEWGEFNPADGDDDEKSSNMDGF
jgi:hypothetical protein